MAELVDEASAAAREAFELITLLLVRTREAHARANGSRASRKEIDELFDQIDELFDQALGEALLPPSGWRR